MTRFGNGPPPRHPSTPLIATYGQGSWVRSHPATSFRVLHRLGEEVVRDVLGYEGRLPLSVTRTLRGRRQDRERTSAGADLRRSATISSRWQPTRTNRKSLSGGHEQTQLEGDGADHHSRPPRQCPTGGWSPDTRGGTWMSVMSGVRYVPRWSEVHGPSSAARRVGERA
ncbi:MAG: hypothetical protein EOP32_10240 [Rhodococcus sp. (in: high G+C Gram-positive bacteria)]|nr:MAG: hypothetical protein EOP32_10240 [Rhodococcus sp. (in: high G+C Gram-positive bacteria)]